MPSHGTAHGMVGRPEEMRRLLVLVKLFETFDLLFGFVLRDAVGLLDLAR
jgi:hypothetical protein